MTEQTEMTEPAKVLVMVDAKYLRKVSNVLGKKLDLRKLIENLVGEDELAGVVGVITQNEPNGTKISAKIETQLEEMEALVVHYYPGIGDFDQVICAETVKELQRDQETGVVIFVTRYSNAVKAIKRIRRDFDADVEVASLPEHIRPPEREILNNFHDLTHKNMVDSLAAGK